MTDRRRGQTQSGAESSTNYQAGGDIVIHGLTREDVKEIALAVFKDNFLELRGLAEDVALARADRITTEFLSKLFREAPEAAGKFGDPDIQRSIYNAQREYACSGEEDLEQVLIDLLIDRVKQNGRSLRTLALNEAITAAPKLTEAQRRAIALVFLVRNTRIVGISGNVEEVAEMRFRQSILRLPTVDEPLREVDFQHIEYVGAGSISFGELSIGEALKSSQLAAFTKGFSEEEIPEELRDSPLRDKLLVDCPRHQGNYQVAISSEQELDKLVEQENAAELKDALKQVLKLGVMNGPAIEDELSKCAPDIEPVIKEWNDSSLKSIVLTSVGIALGHAYWRRFGGATPLSVWM